MSKREVFMFSGLIVLFMFFRIAPELFSIDEAIFIAIFEALSGVISLTALILVAIQISNSNKQLKIMEDQDLRNKKADIRVQLVEPNKSFAQIRIYNVGSGFAFDVNMYITIYTQNDDNKEVNSKKVYPDVIDFYERNPKDILPYQRSHKFSNEVIKSGQYIESQFRRTLKDSYLEITVEYRDASSITIQKYSTKIVFNYLTGVVEEANKNKTIQINDLID